MTARLEFEATITGAKPVIAKTAYDRGKLELTLTLLQPSAPHKPQIPYEWSAADGGWRPRPAALKRKKGEDDDDYTARNGEVVQQQSMYDRCVDRYQEQLAAYHREAEEFQGRTMAYASLIGLAAVFGNKPLVVTLVPMEQGLLPDYGVNLLGQGTGNREQGTVAPVTVQVVAIGGPETVVVEDGDGPCPECGHPLATAHDDGPPSGCSALTEDANGWTTLCKCERGPDGSVAA